MSIQYGNTLVAEATLSELELDIDTLPELELNIETLQDLEVDGSQVRGGASTISTVVAAPAPGAIRMSGTSVISGTSLNPSGG